MRTVPHLVRRERASLAATLLAPLAALGRRDAPQPRALRRHGPQPAAVFHAMLLDPFLSWAAFPKFS